MAKKITVYDAEGNERTVRVVDANEIIERGGSRTKPVKWSNDLGATVYTEEDAQAQLKETNEEETEEEAEKTAIKRKRGKNG